MKPFGTFHIFIIEQSLDNRKFNIGKLKNVGFQLALDRSFDIFALNDVDMIPDCALAMWYWKFPERPVHLAARGTRYTNEVDT